MAFVNLLFEVGCHLFGDSGGFDHRSGRYFGQCWVKNEGLKIAKINLPLRRGWERKVLLFGVKGAEFK